MVKYTKDTYRAPISPLKSAFREVLETARLAGAKAAADAREARIARARNILVKGKIFENLLFEAKLLFT